MCSTSRRRELDPIFRQRLLDRLAAYVSGGEAFVLLSTHITSDPERLADYVTFIRDGRIVFSTTRDEIAETWMVLSARVSAGAYRHREC